MMAYDNNNKNIDTETVFEKRQDRQNRIGLMVLCVAVLAIAAGVIFTLDRSDETTNMIPGTAIVATTTEGTSEAAVAPAAGTSSADRAATNTSSESAIDTNAASGSTTGTNVNSTPAATTETTTPVTENPKTYTSEETCRSETSGACRATSDGWTSVNPAPDKTAVPEAVAPPMTTTTDTTDEKED